MKIASNIERVLRRYEEIHDNFRDDCEIVGATNVSDVSRLVANGVPAETIAAEAPGGQNSTILVALGALVAVATTVKTLIEIYEKLKRLRRRTPTVPEVAAEAPKHAAPDLIEITVVVLSQE